jgi:transcriptional regulator with XRE-family HTH domain
MARKRTVNPRSVTNIESDIGNRIRAYRLDRKLSQGELGDQLGISFQQIQKYEKGTNRISAGRLMEICKVLQITPNDLLGWDKVNAKLGDVIDVEAFKLAKVFTNLPARLKLPVRSLINTMIADGK